MESDSDTDSDDPVMLSYATIYDIIKPVLGDTKIPYAIKKEAQAISNSLEGESNGPKFHELPDLTVLTSVVSVFNQVPPATMAKSQTKDSVLELVIQFICKGVKPKGLVISKISCKAVHKYLLQFNYLILKQGVIHQICITNDVESHHLVLPTIYDEAVLCMLHDDYGHQGLGQTLVLVRERFHWGTVN